MWSYRTFFCLWIKKITKSFYQPGLGQISWFAEDENGKNVVTGTYIYELIYNKNIERGKIVYLK